jgi:uncharacterized protein
MDPAELIREKRQEIKDICAKHGATAVRIFGSVARGDYDEKSTPIGRVRRECADTTT